MLLRWLYSLVFYLAVPYLVYRLYDRAKKNPMYAKRKGERFGFYDVGPLRESVWIHTVSVGEFIAAKPLIERLVATLSCPVVVTTMTPTGSDRVKAALGDRVIHVYLPYDIPFAVKRFLGRFNPKLLLILETELWPNLIHYSSAAGIPVLVANARLSEKSAKAYKRVKYLVRPMLREVTTIAAQTELDGERFIGLGLSPATLTVTGTLKFDLEISNDLEHEAKVLRQSWGVRPVFIAASTHVGEDEQVLEAFLHIRNEVPETLLVIVPRHPERFDDVAEQVRERGWKLARYSSKDTVTMEVDVVLGDTMGELLKFLAASDVAFIGGSLEPVGGHNMLESLAVGTPAVTGPHLFNFEAVARDLEERGVLVVVSTPVGLGDAVAALLSDAGRRQLLGDKGRQVVEDQRGAIKQVFSLVQEHLPPHLRAK